MKVDIRDCLRAYLKDNGYKIYVVAQRTGIDPPSFSMTLRKKRRLDANELLALCEFLKISPTDLRDYKSTSFQNEQEGRAGDVGD